jgi:hypothetical protein
MMRSLDEDFAYEQLRQRKLDEGGPTAEERYLLAAIADLQVTYRKAAQPYVDRLIAIRNMRMPAMIVSKDELARINPALLEES